MGLESFIRIAELATGALARRKAEHDKFLNAYRSLVETVPTEAATAFGTLNGVIVTKPGAKDETWGVELTAADFIWWKERIANGWRIKIGPEKLLRDMAVHLGKKAEDVPLEPAERKELIELLESEWS